MSHFVLLVTFYLQGENSPADLNSTVQCVGSKSSSEALICEMDYQPDSLGYNNALSQLSHVEMTRRLVQMRDLPSDLLFPSTTWEDALRILYGYGTMDSSAEASTSPSSSASSLFPADELYWGGMTADTSIYLQSALNMTQVQADAQGHWRIFSKLGAGYSTSRKVGEIVNNAYACLPVLNKDSQREKRGIGGEVDPEPDVTVGSGLEFTISVRGSIALDASLSQADLAVFTAVNEAVAALLDGRLG